MMKNIKYVLLALVLTYSSTLFALSPYPGQCRDGVDNDGDGRIDALTEVAPGTHKLSMLVAEAIAAQSLRLYAMRS